MLKQVDEASRKFKLTLKEEGPNKKIVDESRETVQDLMQTNMAHTEIFHQLRPSILVIFLTAMSQMTTCYSRSAGNVSVKVKLFFFLKKNLITVATCAFKALMDTSSSFDYAIHFRSCGGYFQLTEHHTLRPSIAIFQINSNVPR